MIGAGILALPMLAIQMGIINSIVFIALLGILMGVSGLLTVDISIKMPKHRNHFASIAYNVWGKYGRIFIIAIFGITMYAALTAYVLASPDVLKHTLSQSLNIDISKPVTSLLFTLLLGSIVIANMRYAEILNRYIVICKLLALTAALLLLSHYTLGVPFHWKRLDYLNLPTQLSVIILAFSYQSLVPSLVCYVGHENHHALRKIIISATAITFIIYLLWIMAIIGFLTLYSAQLSDASHITLVQLMSLLQNSQSAYFTPRLLQIFFNITLFTSFLALSIAFVDFWIDALKLRTDLKGRIIAGVIAFAPPWLIAVYFPTIFIISLAVAGYTGLFFGLLLPVYAAWKKCDPKKTQRKKILFGLTVLSIILMSMILIGGVINIG